MRSAVTTKPTSEIATLEQRINLFSLPNGASCVTNRMAEVPAIRRVACARFGQFLQERMRRKRNGLQRTGEVQYGEIDPIYSDR
jgi:hypothetical protein